MKDAKLNKRFTEVEKKLFGLVSKYRTNLEELDILRSENQHLQRQLSKANEKINSFQNQEKISKIVERVSDSENGSKELKAKINEYIKEIDKCIAQLSDQL